MPRTNLFELFKDQITGNESVLDVGCGLFQDLINFEPSDFRQLSGVTLNFLTSAYGDYSHAKRNVGQGPSIMYFKKRYKAVTCDLNDYDFGKELHNFIICRHCLHFFPFANQFELLAKMYESLKPAGLLYLQMNHRDNPFIINDANAEPRGNHVYGNSKDPRMVYYLPDQQAFPDEIQNRGYDILPDSRQKSERDITLVIKKQLKY